MTAARASRPAPTTSNTADLWLWACRVDEVTYPRISSRTMSLPSDAERQRLTDIAFNLREVFDERGHHVDIALEVDPAFDGGRPRAVLKRGLALDAIKQAASQVGLSFCAVHGEGRELVGEHHRYRLRKAHRDAEGAILVENSSSSNLCLEEEENLFPLESWVFGWIFDIVGAVEDIFVAPIIGATDGNPGYLVLGDVIRLGDGNPFDGGFTPSDEDLRLGDDGDDEEDWGDATGRIGA